MADKYAWEDREMIINLFKNLQQSLESFKESAEKMQKFKLGVLDHPGRLVELKKLIDEDPNWTIADIQTKYDEFKTIYDYLTT